MVELTDKLYKLVQGLFPPKAIGIERKRCKKVFLMKATRKQKDKKREYDEKGVDEKGEKVPGGFHLCRATYTAAMLAMHHLVIIILVLLVQPPPIWRWCLVKSCCRQRQIVPPG